MKQYKTELGVSTNKLKKTVSLLQKQGEEKAIIFIVKTIDDLVRFGEVTLNEEERIKQFKKIKRFDDK